MAPRHYFEKQESSSVIEHFRSDERYGLAEREVALRQRETGKNILPTRPLVRSLIRFISPATVVCLAISALATIMGITSPLFWNSLLIGTFVQQVLYILVQYPTVATVWKTYFSSRKLIPEHTSVIRNGATVEVRARDLVPGDIFYVEEGEYVPCDARILSADRLIVDESFLFGPNKRRTGKNSEQETNVFTAYPQNVLFGTSRVISGSAKAIALYTTKQKVHDVSHVPLFTSPLLKGFYWQCGLFLVGIIILLCIEYLSNLYSAHMHWFFFAIIPFYVPFYIFVLQLSTHKRDVSFPVGHIMVSSDHFIQKDETNSILFFDKEEIDIAQSVRVKKHSTDISSFIELCYLGIPSHLFSNQEHPLLHSLERIRKHLHEISGLEIATQNPNLSLQKESTVYTLEQISIGFQSKTVYTYNDEDTPPLTIHTSSPTPAIDRATYIWDSSEKSNKRRFFPNEKKKLYTAMEQLTEQGYLLYSISFEELPHSSQKTPVFTYVGCIAIPQIVQIQTIQEFKKAQNMGLKATLVSYTSLPKQFYAEKLGISLQNIQHSEGLKAKSQQYKTHLMEESISLIIQSTSDVLTSLVHSKRGIWVDSVLELPSPFSEFDMQRESLTHILQREQRSLLVFNQFQLLCLLSSVQTISMAFLLLGMQSLPYAHILWIAAIPPLILSISLWYSDTCVDRKMHEIPSIRPSLSFSSIKTVAGVLLSTFISLLFYVVFVLAVEDVTQILSLEAFSNYGQYILIWSSCISIPVVSFIFKRYLTGRSYSILSATIIALVLSCLLSIRQESFLLGSIFTAIIGVLCLLFLIHMSTKSVAHMGSK